MLDQIRGDCELEVDLVYIEPRDRRADQCLGEFAEGRFALRCKVLQHRREIRDDAIGNRCDLIVGQRGARVDAGELVLGQPDLLGRLVDRVVDNVVVIAAEPSDL